MIIAFEGMDGCGKTVIAENLVRFINASRGEGSAVLFRDPGSTELGEEVRNLIMNYDVSIYTELFLFSAARAEMVEKCIKPALEKDQIVILDRFIDSTRAYQRSKGVSEYDIESMIDVSVGTIRPDHTIFLDVDPAVGLERKANQEEIQKFEKEGLEYLYRVRSWYINLVHNNDNIIYIDTNNKSLDKVFWEVHNNIDSMYPFMI